MKYEVDYHGSPNLNEEKLKNLGVMPSEKYRIWSRRRITVDLIDILALGEQILERINNSVLIDREKIFIQGPVNGRGV